MSPRSKATAETLVEGDKCSITPSLFSSPAAGLCMLHRTVLKAKQGPGEHVLKHVRAINFMGQMPNKSLLISIEGVEM